MHPRYSAKTPASCKLLTTGPLQSTGGLIQMDASLQYSLKNASTVVITSIYDFWCGAIEGSADMGCDDLPVHKTLITWHGNQKERKKNTRTKTEIAGKTKTEILENNLNANQTLSCHWYMFADKKKETLRTSNCWAQNLSHRIYNANFHSKYWSIQCPVHT